jgi:hypothetical protein
MTDQPVQGHLTVSGKQAMECGGLRFEASFRAPAGATLRVFGDVDGEATELFRFDDFVDAPHYHVPADGPVIPFDREKFGEPLAWYVSQLRDHLAELLTQAGFARLVPAVDYRAVAEHADDITQAMTECVPDGYVRVPGTGLRLSTPTA